MNHFLPVFCCQRNYRLEHITSTGELLKFVARCAGRIVVWTASLPLSSWASLQLSPSLFLVSMLTLTLCLKKKEASFLTEWFTLYTCHNFKIVTVWGSFCVTCDIIVITLSMSMIFFKIKNFTFSFSINLLFQWLRLIWIRFRCLCHRWQNKRKIKKREEWKRQRTRKEGEICKVNGD